LSYTRKVLKPIKGYFMPHKATAYKILTRTKPRVKRFL